MYLVASEATFFGGGEMLDKQFFIELQEYVEKHSNSYSFALFESPSIIEESISKNIRPDELGNFIKNTRKKTFTQRLFAIIDQKDVKDSDIYKKAGIDRRHFSKIRSNPDYRPNKNTVISLAFALQLNKKETDKLLSSAGYSLSESDTFDLVIRFCLEHEIYDLYDVNQALDYFSLKPLVGIM